jgi:DNA-binding beta-propeller fold protein YncE
LTLVNHRLFVADTNNSRVLVYNLDSNDNIVSQSASYVLGQPDFSTSGCGVVSATSMCNPYDLTYDPINNQLFVADQNNSRVLVYDLSGGITNGMAASYVIGQPDFVSNSCNNGGVNANSLCNPYGLTYDSAGNQLFVADGNNSRVLVYDLSSGITNDMAASYELGQPDFSSSSCNDGGVSDTTICNAYGGLTYESSTNELFVSDSYNARVLVFDLSSGITSGMAASYELGQPDFNTSYGCDSGGVSASIMCWANGGLTYESSTNELFVSDSYNARVLVFDLSSGITSGMAASYELGQLDFVSNSCNSSGVTANTLCYPAGLTYSSANNELFVVDSNNSRILVYDLSGGISDGMAAGQVLGQPNFVSSNSELFQPSEQGLSQPNSTILDSINHRLFVTDSNNSRILVYDLSSSNNIVSQNASYELGQPNFTSSGCNTGGISASTLCNPFSGLVFDPATDYLFVADSNNGRVLVYNLSGGITNGMAASYVLGEPDFVTTNYSTTQSGLDNPADLAYDSTTSRLYVSDDDANRVLVYDLSGGITNGMDASYVLGQPDFISSSCNNGGIANNTLCEPYGLYFDDNTGNLYVDDTQNSRVMIYNLAGGITNDMAASFELGQTDFSGDNCNQNASPTASTLCYPFGGMAMDQAGSQLFVMDSENDRILVYNTSSLSNDEAAEGVIGQPDFTTVNWGTSQTQIAIGDPQISYDSVNHQLYVPDDDNNRVLVYDFAHITATTLAGGTVGDSYSQTITESGSQGLVSYSITNGSLPSGIALNTSTGVLSGTPTTAGVSSFTIGLSDNNGVVGTYTDSASYTINIGSVAVNNPSPKSKKKSSTTVTTPATTPVITPTNIDLDNYVPFVDGVGQIIDTLNTSTVLSYTLPSIASGSSGNTSSPTTETHTITLDSINLYDPNNPSVTVTLRSTPIVVSLYLNQAVTEDVNGSGAPEIGLEATSISASGANIKFWRIVPAPVTPTTTKVAAPTPKLTTETGSSNIIWWLVGGGLLVILLGSVIIWKKEKSRGVFVPLST